MTENQPIPPSWNVDVEISFGSPNYVLLAEWLYGSESAPYWRELGDLLGGRPGWHCELTSDGLLWSFGAMRASLFNIGAPLGEPDEIWPATTFDVFDYDADTTVTFESIDEMRTWLEANEHRHADHLRDNLRSWVSDDDWRLLKNYPWRARVAYDGHAWIGTVPSIPSEATIAGDLTSVLSQLRQLITDAFGAPREIAPDLALSVHLDEASTAESAR